MYGFIPNQDPIHLAGAVEAVAVQTLESPLAPQGNSVGFRDDVEIWWST
jgi:hypothetical protein